MELFIQQTVQGIVAPLIAIWLVGFGAFYVVGKHGRYLSLTKALFVSPLIRLGKRFWARYKKSIIILVLGIALGIWIMTKLNPPPL